MTIHPHDNLVHILDADVEYLDKGVFAMLLQQLWLAVRQFCHYLHYWLDQSHIRFVIQNMDIVIEDSAHHLHALSED